MDEHFPTAADHAAFAPEAGTSREYARQAQAGPLRIALLLDEARATAPWVERLLGLIRESPLLDLCAFLRPPGDGARREASHPLFRGWTRIEERLAAHVPPASSPPSPDGARHEPPPMRELDRQAEIAALGLDVILDLTGDFARHCPAHLARHGVWFVDCDTDEPAGAGLDAILAGEPVTRISLYRRVEARDEPLPIATALLNTKFIAARNALFMQEKSVTLILRELHRAQRKGQPAREKAPAFAPPPPVGARNFGRYLAGMLGEASTRVAEAMLARVHQRPGMFFLKSGEGDILSFDPAEGAAHIPRGNAFYADPFLWERAGMWCFFELYDYAARKGSIAAGRLKDGVLTGVRTVLDTDYHLSFPFLFEDEGALYMMPESCAARRIEVWRCLSFPDRWTLHATALEGTVAADSTLTRIDGAWWLFTNISTDPFGEMNSELHLYRVDGPGLTGLVPHPLNPVVFDTRTARNAGRIMERDGVLYRPSQDNSHGVYGHGLNLMRIDRLTGEDYAETLVRRIGPDFEKGIIGCHHLDSRGGMVVFDVRGRRGGW